jgi:hypothetical protein
MTRKRRMQQRFEASRPRLDHGDSAGDYGSGFLDMVQSPDLPGLSLHRIQGQRPKKRKRPLPVTGGDQVQRRR